MTYTIRHISMPATAGSGECVPPTGIPFNNTDERNPDRFWWLEPGGEDWYEHSRMIEMGFGLVRRFVRLPVSNPHHFIRFEDQHDDPDECQWCDEHDQCSCEHYCD